MAAATAPPPQPLDSFEKALSNASIATVDPSTGESVETLTADYAENLEINSPFPGASGPPRPGFTFEVPAGGPINEQYAECVRGFADVVKALAPIPRPRSLNIFFVLMPKSNTYAVTVSQGEAEPISTESAGQAEPPPTT